MRKTHKKHPGTDPGLRKLFKLVKWSARHMPDCPATLKHRVGFTSSIKHSAMNFGLTVSRSLRRIGCRVLD